MNTKKFTILHSNDMHGDFLAEAKAGQGELIGGLALLSGYINKVRREEENVLFVISGDMVQGSLIDSEYKGISTMEIMNYLAPDVVALGNHEFDYGLPHLLFLEKMANFPIVNANLYIKKYHKRLMRPYHIINKAGFDILFTGIITEKIMDSLSTDKLIGGIVTLEEAKDEVGKITSAYKNDDIDLTIVLTHIGLESDIELAKMLDPVWGVDMIIGGHSHSYLEEPLKINNILIAQAGTGTNQIGRFDIVVDDDTNSIVDYSWKVIGITDKIARPDQALTDYINSYKKVVDKKFNTIVSKLAVKHTHPQRETETTLGNLIADAFMQMTDSDIMFVGAGSIRIKELGPLVTLGDLKACFPYDDSLTRFTINGKQLKQIFNFIMRKSNRDGEGECYQISYGVSAVYNDAKKILESLLYKGQPVKDHDLFRVCLQGFHVNNSLPYLNLSIDDLKKNGDSKVVTTSAQGLLEEYFKTHQNLSKKIEGRIIFKDR